MSTAMMRASSTPDQLRSPTESLPSPRNSLSSPRDSLSSPRVSTDGDNRRPINGSRSLPTANGSGSSLRPQGSGIPPVRRTRRSSRNEEEDVYHKKWEGLEKKEEKSRAELLGVTQPRLPKAAIKKLAKGDPRYHDPDSDDPLQRATLEELEDMALSKSKDVTSDLRNVLRITRDTEQIGAQTLENLQKQGEQIARTHDKAVELDVELSKGEKLLSKLGPLCSFGWKPKKGKKISGSKYTSDDLGSKYADRKNRKSLMDKEVDDDESLKTMDRVKKEMDQQDEMLDEVSSSLDVMKNMATDMGNEMDKQDGAIDDLTEDVDELNSRLKQSNQRGKKLLGKK